MNLAMCIGLGTTPALQTLDQPLPPVDARVINEADYTLIISADPQNGNIVLTIFMDGIEFGTFSLTAGEYMNPANPLTSPGISGDATVGAVLTVTPGLWLIEPNAGLFPTYEWRLDDVVIPEQAGLTYIVQPSDAGGTITCRETVGNAFSDTTSITISEGQQVNLIDLTSTPSQLSRLSTSPLPNGIRLTQTSDGAPRISWETSDVLISGSTYRLRGTINILTGQLDGAADIRLSDSSGLGVDVLTSSALSDGLNVVDLIFSVGFVTKVYRMTIRCDQMPGIGSECDVTDFSLEVV